MREKLERVLEAFEEMSTRLSDPEVLADREEYARLAKEYADITPLANKIREYLGVLRSIEDTEEMLQGESDPEMKDLAREEIDGLRSRVPDLEDEVKVMMLPTDPNDEKNVIVEIRAGAGGDEAAIFAGDLYRMYTRFAESRRWKVEDLSVSPSDVGGGFKEVIFSLKGKKVYSHMKYESGVHRVQRVPLTESQGRIHTSTATVAVLPEAEDVEVHVDPNDLRIDVFRSSGPGGQSVNTTDSAVRITHLPTGMVVSCQNQKSQLQNREEAMRILKARLFELELGRQMTELGDARRSQIGTGDRAEKIRTYNFPQDRVTDHRIGLTLHDLPGILMGDIGELIEAVAAADRAEKLAAVV